MLYEPGPFSSSAVIFLVDGDKVLLGTRTYGAEQGQLSGYGGEVDEDENINEVVLEELSSQTGGVFVEEKHLRCVGVVHTVTRDDEGREYELSRLFVYTAHTWDGEAVSSLEMVNPTWYWIKNLWNLNLPLGQKYWLPKFLAHQADIATVVLNSVDGSLVGFPETVRFGYGSYEVKE